MDASFTFIDLFAGIGGTRLAFENAGGRCVFSSEWDRFAQKTYFANFHETPEGDIRKISSDSIADHDVLVAGFPCQPFSIAGVSKKNALGRPHGFLDETQGTLFFEIARIAEKKKPRVMFLENVRNLLTHDGGGTFDVILGTLRELGYWVWHGIVDGRVAVPQHRERLYMVCFREDIAVDFKVPQFLSRNPKLREIIESEVPAKYTLTDHLWKYLQKYADKHRAAGNGFGYGLADVDGVARTLSARYYKDGSEILVPQEGKNPRRLTPRECARLMGFPDWFEIPVSDTQAYKQFGNSVIVPVVEGFAGEIGRCLNVPQFVSNLTRTPVLMPAPS